MTGAYSAQTRPEPVEDDFIVENFRFESGETLPELRLHYITLGTPRRDETGRVRNAVLILHGTGGTGRAFLRPQFADVLFGPGQLLDAARYYLILPDGIGHGGSSKPSDGLRARFPRYAYADMVRAQHQLVTEGLGVDRLRLVMGTSMGGMHTWMWGYLYPQIVDALLPLASLPAPIAGRNRIFRRMVVEGIRSDPAWQNGDYVEQPRMGLRAAIYALLFMVSAPMHWRAQAPTPPDADALFDEMVNRYLESFDANDMLYQFEASRDYDPSPHLKAIQAPLLAVNFADDQVNPPELGILEEAIQRVRRGRAVIVPASAETQGHRTHSLPVFWQEHLMALLQRSDPAVEKE